MKKHLALKQDRLQSIFFLSEEKFKRITFIVFFFSFFMQGYSRIINIPGDFPKIQQGIDAAITGDTVLVQPGIYFENIDFKGKSISVGSLFLTTGNEPAISSTIIDGNKSGSVATFNSGETTNSILTGFTIQNGTGNFCDYGEEKGYYGGGIFIKQSNPSILWLIIKNNEVSARGGGLHLNQSSPQIEHCTINFNRAGIGGGIHSFSRCNPIVKNTVISDNNSWIGGGAFLSEFSSATFENVIISRNSAYSRQGGLFCEMSSVNLTNVLISRNSSGEGKNGLCLVRSGQAICNHVTIEGNGTGDGSNISLGGIQLSLTNSIVVSDQPGHISLIGTEPSSIHISYSNIAGSTDNITLENNDNIIWGSGNIDIDPGFQNASAGDYHLKSFSACIGAGNPTVGLNVDIDNNPRAIPSGSNPDMGVYEHFLGVPTGLPTVTTADVSGIGDKTALSGGNVQSDGGEPVTARGVCWSTTVTPTIADFKITSGSGTGTFNNSLTGLIGNTVYYVRAFATNAAGTGYGSQVTFKTSGVNNRPGWTVEPSDFSYDGDVTALIVENSMEVSGGQGILGAFVGNQCRGVKIGGTMGLTGKYVFILRCYANVSTGEILTFMFYDPVNDQLLNVIETLSFNDNMTLGTASVPVVLHATNACTIRKSLPAGWSWFSINVEGTDLSIGSVLGNLKSSDGDYIKNQTVSATYYDGAGWFGDLTRLNPKEMYKIRLGNTDTLEYTGNPVSTGNNQVTIKNGWNWIGYLPQTANLITPALNSISPVYNDYIKNQIKSSTFYEGSGWFGELSVLDPLDGYMLKTSHIATLTYPVPGIPMITTEQVTGITKEEVTSGGTILDDGGSPITARGVCWSTSFNPTISDNKTSDGIGNGSFTSEMIGLVSNTTYYIRAYATNAMGTAYGNQVSFKEMVLGQPFQGGILAYILQPGDPGYVSGEVHGIIAADSDVSMGVPWNICCPISGTTGSWIGTGLANTELIVGANGDGVYAAKLCYDLVIDSYDDWYLPSQQELNKLYLRKNEIGGFSNKYYWTSTKYDNNWGMSLVIGFSVGDQVWAFNGNNNYVRAIRSF